MSGHHPHENDSQLPGESGVPLLHDPLTQEEHLASAREERIKAEKEADNSYKTRQLALAESSNSLTASNVYITWILAVFTAMGAVAAIYQGHVANKAAIASRDAANAATGAVKVASDTLTYTKQQNATQSIVDKEAKTEARRATQRSLQATIDNFHQEQRAWLSAEPGIGTPSPDDRFSITFPIKNTGRTPAKLVLINWQGKYFSSGEKLSFKRDGKPSFLGSIAPEGVAQFKWTGNGDPGTKLYLATHSTEVFYVFGDIAYQDVFSNRHWTTFCFVLSNATTYGYCEQHNDFGDGAIPPNELR